MSLGPIFFLILDDSFRAMSLVLWNKKQFSESNFFERIGVVAHVLASTYISHCVGSSLIKYSKDNAVKNLPLLLVAKKLGICDLDEQPCGSKLLYIQETVDRKSVV